jgi:(p)ppGpp synthase/HD superfamily hydrolase
VGVRSLTSIIRSRSRTCCGSRGGFGIRSCSPRRCCTARKKLQVARAAKSSKRAKLIKLADKICNLRDILTSPPADWSLVRRREHFDWAKTVVDRLRGTNAGLERRFDAVYSQRP